MTHDASPIRILRMHSSMPLGECASLKIRQWGHRWGMDSEKLMLYFHDLLRELFVCVYMYQKRIFSILANIFDENFFSPSNISFYNKYRTNILHVSKVYIKNILICALSHVTALGLLRFIFNSLSINMTRPY